MARITSYLAVCVMSCAMANSPDSQKPQNLTAEQEQLLNQKLNNLMAKERETVNDGIAPGIVWGIFREQARTQPEGKWRHEMIGEPIQVEGIALGTPSKQARKTDQRVVYEGGRIFVTGVSFLDKAAVGKLVRVTGRLRHGAGPMWRRPGRTYYGKPYYYLEANSVVVLDRVSDSRLIHQSLVQANRN